VGTCALSVVRGRMLVSTLVHDPTLQALIELLLSFTWRVSTYALQLVMGDVGEYMCTALSIARGRCWLAQMYMIQPYKLLLSFAWRVSTYALKLVMGDVGGYMSTFTCKRKMLVSTDVHDPTLKALIELLLLLRVSCYC
jgi:hypothetical protein